MGQWISSSLPANDIPLRPAWGTTAVSISHTINRSRPVLLKPQNSVQMGKSYVGDMGICVGLIPTTPLILQAPTCVLPYYV